MANLLNMLLFTKENKSKDIISLNLYINPKISNDFFTTFKRLILLYN